jgi:Rrf2 family protein
VNSSSPLITQTAEYALRAMSCLATTHDTFVRAEELSKGSQVPKAYLSKILRKMVVAELVLAKRGHHGGFQLARPASQITLQDVLAAVDALPTNRCAFGVPQCDPDRPCPLHDAWMELKRGYLDWMTRHSLSEMENTAWCMPDTTIPPTP